MQTRVQMMQKALKLQKALNLVKLKFLPLSDSSLNIVNSVLYESIKTTIVIHIKAQFVPKN